MMGQITLEKRTIDERLIIAKSLIESIIDDLPSAQPDKDLIHLQKEQAYMQGWEDGQKALREEMWEYEREGYDQQTGGDR